MLSSLDQLAISIELTLISVIEGVALYFLVQSATLLTGYEYLPFVLAGFLFILMFWAQALLHAVSFIRWPIRTGHMFLYFAAAFIQAVAYTNITNPERWFFWWLLFSLLIAVLYIADLGLIRHSRKAFRHLEGGESYMDQIEQRQRFELRTLVPLAILLNLGVLYVLHSFPALQDEPNVIILLGFLQVLTALGSLIDTTRNFRLRGDLVGALLQK